jgi:hypothetical protein
MVHNKTIIEKNEELLINYEVGITTYEQRKYQFNIWGFNCNCEYCIYDKENKIGEKIFQYESQILKLGEENKMEDGITLYENFNTFILNIDKKFVNSEIFHVMQRLYFFLRIKFSNRRIEDTFKSFLVDLFDYNDRGQVYHKVIYIMGSLILEKDYHKELLKKYKSNCCEFIKNIITLESSK